MRIEFAVLLQCVLLLCTQSASAVNIELVTVGNPGNAPDPLTGFGRVDYEYQIGKYEVTIGQYAEFLNAVAATDTYYLYSFSMLPILDFDIAGITRSGMPGNFTYDVLGSPHRPIANVSWGDAARFANWLHNGQPAGAQGPGTTEDGAYTLNGALTQTELNAVSRNGDARWFLPSEDEWYKAAYHQPADKGGDSDSYWLYPMRTNEEPYSDQPPGATPDNTRTGNFYKDDKIANGYDDGFAATGLRRVTSDNLLTDVGAYPLSFSYYGTFDQGGNVNESNEALIDTFNWGLYRGARGGDCFLGFISQSYTGLESQLRSSGNPVTETSSSGFRIAAAAPVPDPTSLTLFSLTSLMLGTGRYKTRRS